jgi:hypothetical protein
MRLKVDFIFLMENRPFLGGVYFNIFIGVSLIYGVFFL